MSQKANVWCAIAAYVFVAVWVFGWRYHLEYAECFALRGSPSQGFCGAEAGGLAASKALVWPVYLPFKVSLELQRP